MEILSILDTLLGPHQQQTRGEMLYACPFCNHHKKKLAINISNGKWHCWVCEAKGSRVFTLLRKIKAPRKYFKVLSEILSEGIEFEEDTEETVLTLPTQYIPLWEPSRDLDYRQAWAYLKSRGVSNEDVLKYQLGYCKDGTYSHRIVIPSFDIDGKLNFFSGRSYISNATFPYLNPRTNKNIIGFESLISWEFPIVICEGPMDAIAIRRNAIPMFGKTIPSELVYEILAHEMKDIYLALDKDALRKALNIAEFFMDQDVNVHLVRMEEKDPGEIGFEGMQDLIKTTEKVTVGGLMKATVFLSLKGN